MASRSTAAISSSPVSRTTKRAPLRPLRATPVAKRAPAPTPSLPSAAPIIKWVGGKSKLLPELTSRMPATFNRYFEPFAGGLAMYFRVVSHSGAARSIINDGNPDLVALYRVLASDVEALIRRLAIHRNLHNQEHYYSVRARWNDASVSWSAVDRAAAFIYLNKTCFNGLWRLRCKAPSCGVVIFALRCVTPATVTSSILIRRTTQLQPRQILPVIPKRVLALTISADLPSWRARWWRAVAMSCFQIATRRSFDRSTKASLSTP